MCDISNATHSFARLGVKRSRQFLCAPKKMACFELADAYSTGLKMESSYK